MELLKVEFLGKNLRLEGSMAGWQQLFWGDNLVSEIAASADDSDSKVHHFEMKLVRNAPLNQARESPTEPTHNDTVPTEPLIELVQCRLEVDLQWQPFNIQYRVLVNGENYTTGARNSKDIEQQVPERPVDTKRKLSLIGLASLGMKLLKSAKLIKVILAGASLAAYSWFFSFQFALALLACLVFHEYGHIRAMKYFNMPTKGIYLIPFFGGLALTDGKINTRWQDVVISIMGPFFGLIMSLACVVAYWITDNIFFAGLATFNALLNIFNLLPILPLDGGHILKSVSFSMNSKIGLVVCVLAAAFGVWLSYSLGLALLGFLLLIGSIEIFFEWKGRHQSHLLPLDRYGQIFTTVWYLGTVASFVAIIWYFASSGDTLLSLPLQILQS
ncbi:site-2 protease family protein [Alkalimarinus alittae]|uniref:Site-2 protease family protein n=1 Tax=Alkalimarinus alittae TaxID=2961619 RepID=A0ABY6N2I8_9ALTE|nr:site-2 protease family protein [Alkalimarinus alittae]UZE96264.1 site-2 protease family protein [Alkalimarinus alittae]